MAKKQEQQQASINNEQVRKAAAAALEVLNGAPSDRVLALSGDITLAKLILQEVVSGRAMLAQPKEPSAPPAGLPMPSRSQRRVAGKR